MKEDIREEKIGVDMREKENRREFIRVKVE